MRSEFFDSGFAKHRATRHDDRGLGWTHAEIGEQFSDTVIGIEIDPLMTDALSPQVVDQIKGTPRVARANDADRPRSHTPAEDLATGYERGEHDVADLRITGQQATEILLIDPEDAPSAGHSAVHHRTLAGEQTQLAKESSRAVRHDHRLRAARLIDVDDFRRTFEDNDKTVRTLALTEQGFAGPDVVLAAEVRQSG